MRRRLHVLCGLLVWGLTLATAVAIAAAAKPWGAAWPLAAMAGAVAVTYLLLSLVRCPACGRSVYDYGPKGLPLLFWIPVKACKTCSRATG